ncbi:uncharacterized protein B0T23DRAFT_389828 [Neurospora hispaniola]|uniref:Uncharacterized protein n=1 Tax=Neurospora hispaniola TaxID=588809 RepID=A0AAJ0HYC6_9PEZI|nr:hypothetical protein B0T23DRAFT_389828 [Neurospora hispaniola]
MQVRPLFWLMLTLFLTKYFQSTKPLVSPIQKGKQTPKKKTCTESESPFGPTKGRKPKENGKMWSTIWLGSLGFPSISPPLHKANTTLPPRPPHINPRKAGVGRCGLRQRLHTLATQSLKPVKIDDMPGRRTRQSLAGKDDFYLTSKDSEKLIRGRKESGQPRTLKVSLSIDQPSGLHFLLSGSLTYTVHSQDYVTLRVTMCG